MSNDDDTLPNAADDENVMQVENLPGDDESVEGDDPKALLTSNRTAVTPTASTTADNAVLYSPELLQMYYSHLFPFSLLHGWLSYGNAEKNGTTASPPSRNSVFSHREFSFTIEPVKGEEIYIRYQSFAGKDELQQAILKRRPSKIDIGAVFNHPPKDKNTLAGGSGKLQPVQRELVFDIDLTDYDDVRRCGCTGAKICGVCWKLMAMAVRVVDVGLREDFGFTNVAWFYSGRRGVHAWVCDEAARALTDRERSAVASYFDIDLGTEKNKKVSLPDKLHPMMTRAFEILEPMFMEQVLPAGKGQGLLATADGCLEVLQTLPEVATEIRENLMPKLFHGGQQSNMSPQEKWILIKKHVAIFTEKRSKSGTAKAAKTLSNKDEYRLKNWPAEVVFRYAYPRLDVNVSKMRNHLLKSPFCVHPKTGRVCVPIPTDRIEQFDPFGVPTLPQLMKELDDYGKEHGDSEQADVVNWKKTSLKEYFEYFEKDFLEPMQKEWRRLDRDAAEQEAALSGDF